MEIKSETFQIEGMSCGHCVQAVRRALEEVPGVDVQDVQIGSARVNYNPGQTDPSKITEAVEEAGYRINTIRTE
jgi:copper chaperone